MELLLAAMGEEEASALIWDFFLSLLALEEEEACLVVLDFLSSMHEEEGEHEE